MIITDELVTKIAEEIARRIAAGQAPPPPAAAGPSGSKPDLIVAGPAGDPLSCLPAAAAEAVRGAFAVHPVSAFEAEGLPKVPVLLPRLPIQPLVRVAHGDEGCTVEGRQLLCALLEGRTAVVWDDGIVWRRYAATAPGSLVAIWRRCEAALAEAGVRIVPAEGLVAALTGKPPASLAKPEAAAPIDLPPAATRVLTESKVMALFPPGSPPGELALGPGDVLTPLAKDYLSAAKIRVARRPEGGRP
jgi:hypothetical protein